VAVAVRLSAADRDRRIAGAETLLVTILWASSWVLIKVGLADLDLRPLSFAGLRYAVAAVILIPFGWRAISRARRSSGGGPDRRLVGRLVLVGITVYAAAQGAQFAALALLPAASVGLILATNPLLVAAIAWLRGAEAPSRVQTLGIAVLLIGAGLYFGRLELGPNGPIGLAIAAVSVTSAALGQHLSRDTIRDVRDRLGGPIGFTAVSMAIGGFGLLAVGIGVEGWPHLDVRAWAIVLWLAAVNTAFAFTLFNWALRHLSAAESSTIVNLMLVMVATMAWVFLGESLSALQVAGLAVVSVGVLIVQVAPILRARRASPASSVGPAAGA
jgi:drug/metabolite transporter (DMT)-like permease